MSPLAERVLAGDPRAVARAISLIEDDDPAGMELVREMFGRTGRAYLIGVTGPPGAGKSTLVDRLIVEMRKAGRKIGVIAVDPTSPFTGGAVLGDRVRMQTHAGDEAVFIRSMATRGHLGGLARATGDAALVLDAAGKDVIIIETVGVGQDEVEIARTADVSIVTLVPGTGDEVQALKAGIMEIADVFVVNKADREGADRLQSAIEGNLSLHSYRPDEWRPPIVQTVATTGTGIPALVEAIDRFRAYAESPRAPGTPEAPDLKVGPTPGPTYGSADGTARDRISARRRERGAFRLRELLSHRFLDHLERHVLAEGELQRVLDRIAAREVDPYSAADALLKRTLRG